MPTLWFDSTDFVSGDPTLQISYPSVTQALCRRVSGSPQAGKDRSPCN